MKSVGDLVAAALEKPATISTGTISGRRPKNSLDRRWTLALFEKLRIRYGNLWTKQIGETPKQIESHLREWSQVLAGVTGEQISSALDNLGEYPPNAYRFKALCKSVLLPEAHRPYRRIEHAFDKDAARSSIEDCKRSLCGIPEKQ